MVAGGVCIITGNWRGASNSGKVLQTDTHHTRPSEMGAWVGPIASCHRGNKRPKIGMGAGNGFYWRTNQGGHFSGAQFSF